MTIKKYLNQYLDFLDTNKGCLNPIMALHLISIIDSIYEKYYSLTINRRKKFGSLISELDRFFRYELSPLSKHFSNNLSAKASQINITEHLDKIKNINI